jgi:tetratricopeptide (TPR) repeat protein
MQEAIKEYKLALSNIDRMTEREKLRTQGAYYAIIRDPDKSIEEQTELLKRYPADSAGHANLALAYFFRRDMTHALEEGERAVEIYPRYVAQRNNVGLFAMYAGDFDRAITEQKAVLGMNPSFALGYVGMALSQLALGKDAEALATYDRLAKLGPEGASSAAIGSADLAMYEGRPADAASILQEAIPRDLNSKDTDAAARKLALLAQAKLALEDAAGARESAQRAASMSDDTGVQFWAARAYMATGEEQKASAIAKQLGGRLQSDPQAYGKLIEAELDLRHGRVQQAIRGFAEARGLADTWLGHLDTAEAYLQADAYDEAYSELQICQKRRGEATAVFLDESPTLEILPSVYYYLGLAQEGLHSPAARDSFEIFVSMKRNGSNDDPMVNDARNRLEGKSTVTKALKFLKKIPMRKSNL